MIETSEAALPHPPRPQGMSQGWGGGREGPSLEAPHVLPEEVSGFLSSGHSAPQNGDVDSGLPPAPPGTHSCHHLEGRTPHIWKSDSIRGWRGQVFHFPSRCLARVLRKQGEGEGPQRLPEIPQGRRQPEAGGRDTHTQGGTLGGPLFQPCPGPLTFRPTNVGCHPRGPSHPQT